VTFYVILNAESTASCAYIIWLACKIFISFPKLAN